MSFDRIEQYLVLGIIVLMVILGIQAARHAGRADREEKYTTAAFNELQAVVFMATATILMTVYLAVT